MGHPADVAHLRDPLVEPPDLVPARAEQQRQLIGAINRAYQGQTDEIRVARDRRLAGILRGIEQAREE